MKKHREIKETNTIGALLNSTIFAQAQKDGKMGAVMKHSTIFSFWNSIVGAKFANFTKPYAIKGTKIYVSAKSPVIVQELNLYKTKIIKNINSYSMPLGIQINDIIFSYKNYAVSSPIENNQIEDKPIEIAKKDLKNIEVDIKTQEEIKKHIQKIDFLNDSQKEKFTDKILSTYQAKIVRQNEL